MSLEQRQSDVRSANRRLARASEAWAAARVTHRGTGPLHDALRHAEREAKKAQTKLERAYRDELGDTTHS